MKSIFEQSTRNELINRIHSLDENSKAQWGKMTLYQMVRHCRLWEEMVLGRKAYKRVFMGRIFGKMALKMVSKDDTPIKRNAPTIPELKIPETHGDLAAEKQQWITLINEYAHFHNPGFIHPFFGKMTREQIGNFVYKHSDHHLRQFNC